MADYSKKPLPHIHEETRIFWEKAKEHELWLQKCRGCGKFRFYPRSICPYCFSYNADWSKVSGRGKIYSFTVSYRPSMPAFQKDVPYCLALVDLEEGARIMTNIVEYKEKDLRIGMPVEVVFEDVTPEISLPKFRPTGAI